MSAADALSNRQFGIEQNLLAQGNMDALATRVRGFQNMTSNVFRPSFSSDYQAFQPNPSPARAGQQYEGDEEEGDEGD